MQVAIQLLAWFLGIFPLKRQLEAVLGCELPKGIHNAVNTASVPNAKSLPLALTLSQACLNQISLDAQVEHCIAPGEAF